MKRTGFFLAWVLAAAIGVLVSLNWATLMAAAPLNLLVMQVQAPLGIVMLGLAGILVALFFIAYLRSQIGSLLETRRLLHEVQRVQALADTAEASRIENLHQLITTEFRLLNERLSSAANAQHPTVSEEKFSPVSLTEIVTGRRRA